MSALIPFASGGYGEFDRGYVAVLEDWAMFRDGRNPVARSNVAPEVDPPAEPGFRAFCYTVHDFHPLVREIAARTGASSLVWHYCRPPIAEIEFEMDLRGVSVERVLA